MDSDLDDAHGKKSPPLSERWAYMSQSQSGSGAGGDLLSGALGLVALHMAVLVFLATATPTGVVAAQLWPGVADGLGLAVAAIAIGADVAGDR